MRKKMFYEKIVELDKALSLDYLTQVITIRGKDYVFGPATTLKEENQQVRQRKKLISILIKDAAHVLAEEAINDYWNFQDVSRDSAWYTIDAILDNIPSRQEVQSPIDPASIAQIKIDAKEKKQIGLDYSSYQVKMQDPSIEDIDGWDLDDN